MNLSVLVVVDFSTLEELQGQIEDFITELGHVPSEVRMKETQYKKLIELTNGETFKVINERIIEKAKFGGFDLVIGD